MPPAPKPLPELAVSDPATFQTHWLRAYAPMLPWYTRPQLSETQYPLDDFLEMFRTKMVDAVKPPAKIGIVAQDLGPRRSVLKHLSYAMLWQATYRHTDGIDEAELQKRWAQEARYVRVDRKMRMNTPHHPFYGSYKASPFPNDSIKKLLDASAADRELAEWFERKPLRPLIDAAPEFVSTEAGARVSVYAVKMRTRLKEILAPGKVRLDPGEGDEAVYLMTDEWGNLKKGHAGFDDEVARLITEEGLEAHADHPEQLAVRVKAPVTVQTREEEARLAPLYEQTAMLGAAMGYNPVVHGFIREWAGAIARLQIPACERPSLAIAILAMELREPKADLARVRSKI